MKYLGVDWGEKRIGLAVGDSETKIATPFKVVNSIKEVLEVIKIEQIDTVVVGEPYQISNFQFPISKKFEKFINDLKNKTKAHIELIDERLSSKAADALVGDRKTKAPRDMLAAMLILQTYLDKHESKHESKHEKNEKLRK